MIGCLRFRLSKHFGAKNVLDAFALEVRGGEFVTFLGPSGCGKSTALNLLAGLLAPSAGEIWLEDQRIDALPPERRGFGMVFQNYALFPHLSVFDNVAFGLDVRRLPRTDIAERVRRMLELVRLEGLAARYPGQLSGRGVSPFGVGAGVRGAVRREDVRLTADPPGLNVLQGQVRLIEYQGREYDVEVGLESGATVKARLPRAVPVGSAVNLALDAERVVILPPDGTVAA